MATKTTYTKNADGTITSRFDQVPDAPNPTTQAPIQPAQPQQTVSPNGTTYTRNADGTITSRFADTSTPQQPTQPAQPQQPAQPITDWKNLNDAQKTNENLAKLVENRYNTKAEMLPDGVSANVGDTRYSWYLDEGKNPIRTNGAKNTNANQQTDAQGRPLYGPNGERYVYGNDGTVRTILPDGSQKAPAGLTFDRNSSWNALDPKDKTINNLQKLIEARYGTLAEVEGDRVVADIGGKMYQWTLDQNGNPVKTEVPADNTQFNSGEILEQLKVNPNLDLSTYDPTQAAIAKNNFTKIQNFDGMNSDQLNESLQSGALLVGTTVRNNINPQQRQIVDMVSTLNMIKGIFLDPLLINENAEKNILANAGPLAQALEDNYLSTAEVDEITITPEMKQMKNNADFWGDEMNRLRTNYEYLEDDIEEELKGQNATASYRDRYMAKEGKALYRALTTAQRNYQMYYGQYNDERERAMQLLNTNIQLYQKAQDRAYEEEQQLKERQWQLAMQNYGMVTDYMQTLEDRAYKEQRYEYEMAKELEQAQKKMDLQLQYEYGDLNSDNPMLVQQAIRRSIQGMYDTYSSLVPGLENPEISYEKVMQKIANGMSPAQALQERHDEIKNSKRLQQALANEQNKLNYDNWKMNEAMTPTTSGYSGYSGYSGTGMSGIASPGLSSSGDGNYVSPTGTTYNYDANKGQFINGSGMNISPGSTVAEGFDVNNKYTTQDGTAMSCGVKQFYAIGEKTGYACGGFAMQRAGLSSMPGGNDLEQRKKTFSDSTPTAGGLVLFTGGGYNPTYGHVAYVKSVEPDGSIRIEESNWHDGQYDYNQRHIGDEQAKNLRYYNNTPASKQAYTLSEVNTQNSGTQAQVQNDPMTDIFNKYIEKGTTPSKAILDKYFGGDELNFIQAKNNYQNSMIQGSGVEDIVGLDIDDKFMVAAMIKKVFGGNPSDAERNYLIEIVQGSKGKGYGINDYTTAFQGFDILHASPEERAKIDDVVQTALNAGGDLGDLFNVSKSYQSGGVNGAYKYLLVSNEFLNSEDKKIKWGDINTTIEKVYRAMDEVDMYGSNNTGPIKGRLAGLKADIVGNPEYRELQSVLEDLNSARRKELLGQAQTESEKKSVENVLGASAKMTAEDIKTVLKMLARSDLSTYMNERTQAIPAKIIGDIIISNGTVGAQTLIGDYLNNVDKLKQKDSGTSSSTFDNGSRFSQWDKANR